MSPGTDHILQTALALPHGEQVELIEALIAAQAKVDSQPLSPDWLAEIQRRSDEYDAGKVPLIPWEVVRTRTRGEGQTGA
jgi:putative addiction module component (TIGR02574 family)